MRYILLLSLVFVSLQMAGCGAEAPSEPDQVVVITVTPTEAICTDVVIWDQSAESDCVAAGGVYESKVWPIGSVDTHMVCNFCPAASK